MNTDLHFSSATDEWATPDDIFQAIAKQYGPFTLDPASTHENAKCAQHFTQAEDGLSRIWTGRVWLNPPLGKRAIAWVEKCFQSAMNGTADIVVALLPARTDTKAFHAYVWEATRVISLQGRVRFLGPNGALDSAPFPSMIVVWEKGNLSFPCGPHFIRQSIVGLR